MAFDGRSDPNKGYDEKSPCTFDHIQFKVPRSVNYQISGTQLNLLLELTL